MRPLLAIAAAVAVAAGPLAASAPAWAKDHRDGPRGEQSRGEGRGGEGRWNGRGGGPPMGWRGEGGPSGGEQRIDPRDPRFESRGDPRAYGDPRYEQRGDPRAYGYEQRGYGYDRAPPQAYGAPRRGGFLGPQGGAPIEDPSRYRLRAAPRGYVWMRVPGGSALVSRGTGQVFDVVPDDR